MDWERRLRVEEMTDGAVAAVEAHTGHTVSDRLREVIASQVDRTLSSEFARWVPDGDPVDAGQAWMTHRLTGEGLQGVNAAAAEEAGHLETFEIDGELRPIGHEMSWERIRRASDLSRQAIQQQKEAQRQEAEAQRLQQEEREHQARQDRRAEFFRRSREIRPDLSEDELGRLADQFEAKRQQRQQDARRWSPSRPVEPQPPQQPTD